ncbi:MAG TPA: DUF192 domain-containing protein [Acidobacteriota bacterium]|nr:DUF192 domain-containing protein [Acidobacteriota bacterium]
MKGTVFLGLLILTAFAFSSCGIEETIAVTFPDGRVVRCEIADAPKKMEAGLTTYSDLAPGQGMIFIYPSPRQGVSFWMPAKMKFQIDMIFLNGEKRVVMIEKQVPICESNLQSDCPGYGPPVAEVQFVVEVVAGLCDEIGLKQGDSLEFVFP